MAESVVPLEAVQQVVIDDMVVLVDEPVEIGVKMVPQELVDDILDEGVHLQLELQDEEVLIIMEQIK